MFCLNKRGSKLIPSFLLLKKCKRKRVKEKCKSYLYLIYKSYLKVARKQQKVFFKFSKQLECVCLLCSCLPVLQFLLWFVCLFVCFSSLVPWWTSRRSAARRRSLAATGWVWSSCPSAAWRCRPGRPRSAPSSDRKHRVVNHADEAAGFGSASWLAERTMTGQRLVD